MKTEPFAIEFASLMCYIAVRKMNMPDNATQTLLEKKAKVAQGGGQKRIDDQHAKGDRKSVV